MRQFPVMRARWMLVAVLLGLVQAQSTPPPQVTIPFFALDHHDQPVEGITQSDISIIDGKQPAKSIVGLHAATDLPLRVGILFDASNSERNNPLYPVSAQAATTFMNQVLHGDNDRLFVERFSTTPEATGFMDRHQVLRLKIDVAPEGGTSLYDAVVLACSERMLKSDPTPARRVLVILSDGEDNQSHFGRKEAIAAAQASGTVIFTVSTFEGGYNASRGDNVLKKMAQDTGGDALRALDSKEMPKVFARIEEQIESMYSVSYIPVEAGEKGKFRSVEIKHSNEKLTIRAPKGYFTIASSH